MRLVTVAFGSGWGQGEGRGWASRALEGPTAVGPLPLTAPSFLALQACPRRAAKKSGHYPPVQGHVGHPETRGPQSIQPQAPGGRWGARGPASTGTAPAAPH